MLTKSGSTQRPKSSRGARTAAVGVLLAMSGAVSGVPAAQASERLSAVAGAASAAVAPHGTPPAVKARTRVPRRLDAAMRRHIARERRGAARLSSFSGAGRFYSAGSMACSGGTMQVKDDLVVSTNLGREFVKVTNTLFKWGPSGWVAQLSSPTVTGWDAYQLDALDTWYSPTMTVSHPGWRWTILTRGYYAIAQQIQWVDRYNRVVDSVNGWTHDAMQNEYCLFS